MDNGSQAAKSGGGAPTGSTKAASRNREFRKWMRANGGGYNGGAAPF